MSAYGDPDMFEETFPYFDLDEEIENKRTTLAFCPPNHPEREYCLEDLALTLWDRFELQGQLSDLNEAIDLHQATLELRPTGHEERDVTLNNLAIALRKRFDHQGMLTDLHKCIDVHRATLALRPPGHDLRSSSLNNLANALRRRFEQQGLLADLSEAIKLHRMTVDLRPPGDPNRPRALNNLGKALLRQFQRQGHLPNLTEAIELHRAALEICPLDDAFRPSPLGDLAYSLQVSYEQYGLLSDLSEAIELHRAALEFRPPGHVYRPVSLSHLAYCLQRQFEMQGGQGSGIDEAMEISREALDCCPEGYHLRAGILEGYNELLLNNCNALGESSVVDEAFSRYSSLAGLPPYAVSHHGFMAAISWTGNSEKFKHPSSLDAYKCALAILDRVVNLAPSATLRQQVLQAHTSTLAADAFSCAVRQGSLETAVELIEQGRGMLWAQLARFRTPLDALMASDDQGRVLAEQLKETSRLIRQSADSLSERELSQLRTLQTQFDDILSEIRTLPGFSRFLLPPTFSALREAATSGPLIVVNASEYSCDAVIILWDHSPVHVPLPDITKREVAALSSSFRDIIQGLAGYAQKTKEITDILRDLWSSIVEPIVEELERLHIPHRSRIWWCPTADFTALPLHAAGLYARGTPSLLDKYVSSYTPTICALLRAMEAAQAPRAYNSRFMVIAQGQPYEGDPLDCLPHEIETISRRLIDHKIRFNKLEGSQATVDRVLNSLSHRQFVHLACHGRPDADRPLTSSFAMGDGPLSLMNLITAELKDPQFAFLSACHTAASNTLAPDEVIHLAAGMQFAGFRSVIGTMWHVDDQMVSRIVEVFYESMLKGPGGLDGSRAAWALNEAVQKLRGNHGVPLEQRIVFIHIGI